MTSKLKVNIGKNGKNGDLWYRFISNGSIAAKSVTFECSWSEKSNSVLLSIYLIIASYPKSIFH